MSVTEIKVYNNLTRKKEVFKPLEEGKVKFYSCGPTTYDFLHVGNARALVVGDLMNRIMRTLGYQVTFVRNFTDVDDKIIERAKELNVDALEHSDRFVKECQTDMNFLGMNDADHTPKVSETMEEIIKMIQEIIDNGYGYEVNGEVLYHVPKFDEYGKLSKKDLESLEHGKRVEVDTHKKHPSDFVLWKPAKEGEISWPSPWGDGRPGWHIECSAMSRKFLGKQIDLHHGGVDLMFPHHENEIAQSEAANGCEFSGHWCHNEFLNFGKEKMSKSLGNVITIRNFCETYGGEILRQVLMSVHYRSKMDWSTEVIEKAINDLERIHKFSNSFNLAKKSNFNKDEESDQKSLDEISGLVSKMKQDLANDFNVPGALAHFFSGIRLINKLYLDEAGNFSKKKPLNDDLVQVIEGFINFTKDTLGCVYENPQEILNKLNKAMGVLKSSSGTGSSKEVEAEIEQLIIDRKEARAKKDWATADKVRDRLKELKVEVKDNPDGTSTWKYV